MTELEYLLREYNFPRRTAKSKMSIEDIEKKIGFLLPDDYKFYLNNYTAHEGIIGSQYAAFWDMDNVVNLNENYQILQYLPSTIAIGSNMGGEFIAIEVVAENIYRIILSPFIGLEKEYHIEIGDSFTNLFVRLNNGQGWFA